MSRSSVVSALLLVFASAGAVRAQVPGAVNHAADERAAYRAVAMRDAMVMLGDWQNAWIRDDLRSLSRLYDQDAMVRLPGAAEVQGRAKLAELLRDRLPQLGRVELLPVDARVGGELLYLFQRYTIAPPDEASDLSTPPLYS